jgi:hypothetical protein
MSNTITYTAGQSTWITVFPIGFRDGTLERILGIYTTVVNDTERVGSFSTLRNTLDETSTSYNGEAVEVDDQSAQNALKHNNPQTFQVSISLRSANDLEEFNILWKDANGKDFPLTARKISK